MNEPNLPRDELASAFLDGELAAAASAAVGRDPETAARVDELRRAAGAVAAPVTPPAGAADAAVEAALADFEARRAALADPVRLRARRLPLIAGVAAAVAIGFIVAAALGLFAERGGVDDTATMAAPAPPPAAPAAADEPAAVLAAEAEAAVEMAAPPPPAEPEPAPEPAPPPLAAPEPMAQPDEAPALAAPADEQAATEAAAAAPAQAESAAAQAALPPAAEAAAAPAEAAPAAGSEMMDGDDMAAGDVEAAAERAAAAPDGCVAAVGDGTVELRITVGETPVLVSRTTDERLVALNGATCVEIPAEPADAVHPLPSESCVAAVGDGRIALNITVGETPVLIVHTVDVRLVAIDAATCDDIPATEPG